MKYQIKISCNKTTQRLWDQTKELYSLEFQKKHVFCEFFSRGILFNKRFKKKQLLLHILICFNNRRYILKKSRSQSPGGPPKKDVWR